MQNFEFNLSVALAHSAVYFSRLEFPRCESATNGGDPPAPPTAESTAEILQAFTKYLPALSSTINQTLVPSELAQLEAQKQVTPAYSQLQTELLSKYGPQLAEAGNTINRISQTGQAETDAALLGGPLRDAVRAGVETQQIADPEFYAARENIGEGLARLLGGMDPNTLTGAELANVERGVNRSNVGEGTAGSGSKSTAISNALMFGDELTKKRQLFSNALAQATSFLQPSRSGVFEGVTGKGTAPNAGVSQFLGVDKSVGSNANALANNFLGGLTQLQAQHNQINADRRDSLDRVSGLLGSLPT